MSYGKVCEACDSAPPADLSEAKAPPRVFDAGEVLAVKVITDCPVRHIIDVTGVLFDYFINMPVTCSFPTNHTPHRSGLIAVTRCGVTVRAGADCAETHVIGWIEVQKNIRRLRKNESRVNAIALSLKVYAEARARVRALSPWLVEANELAAAGAILTRIHDLHDEIAAAGNARSLNGLQLKIISNRAVELFEERDRLGAKLNGFVDRELLHANDQRRKLWDKQLAPSVRDTFKAAQKLGRR